MVRNTSFKILNTSDYLKEEKKFFEKHNIYVNELIEINKEENFHYDNGTLTDELKNKYDEQRKELEKKHGKYSSIYKADFYCWLSYKNINVLVHNQSTKDYFKKALKLVGKKVQSKISFSTYGLLKGIAIMPDDIYYVINDETDGHDVWESGVGGIKLYDKWEHRCRQIVTTPDDKGYI